MPVELALAALYGIFNDGKRSTSLPVWCWEKVKASEYLKRQEKYLHQMAGHAVSAHKQIFDFYLCWILMPTDSFAVLAGRELSLCTNEVLDSDNRTCLSESESLCLSGKSHLKLDLQWISFVFWTCFMKS